MKDFAPPATEGQDGGSTLLDKILGMIQDSFDSLALAVLNNGIVESDLTVGADIIVRHGLGAAPRAIDLVGLNANAVVWESATPNNQRSQFVLMRASANCHVKLRFS